MSTCKKHGFYSTLCRACDLDTIKEHNVFTTLQEVDHYKFIKKYGKLFASLIEIKDITDMDHFSIAEGDKTYSYKERWSGYRIPFPMATMVYYLSKENPYSKDNRDTEAGWVPVEQWVVSAILGVPKKLEGTQYENLRKAYIAVLQQYIEDIGF